MSSTPVRPASDADLDRNASMYRAAVTRSERRGLGPIGFLVVASLISIVLVCSLAGAVVLYLWRNPIPGSGPTVGPRLITKAAPPVRARPPVRVVPSAMPSGPDAFRK